MKKHFAVVIIAIFILLNFSNVSLADYDHRTWPFQIGKYELTNPNPDNPKLYVLHTGLSVLLSNDEHDLGYMDIQLLDDFNYLGIDFNDYEVLSYKVYNPDDFDFNNDNVIRAMTPYSKNQDDFDRFYYRPGNLQWGESFFVAEGCLRGGFQFRYNKDLAICDLNKYLKLPGAEETLIDLYQLGDLADRFIEFAKGNTGFDDSYSYSDSHLFSYALVVELEKKVKDVDFSITSRTKDTTVKKEKGTFQLEFLAELAKSNEQINTTVTLYKGNSPLETNWKRI